MALLLALSNYGIRAIRWHWYLHALSIPIPLRDNFPIFLIGLMLSVTPGKAGELLKAYLVKLSCGTSMARTAPVVVVERLTDMTGMLILATLGLISIRVRGELVLGLWGLMAVGLILLSNRRVMHGCIGWARSVLSQRMAERFERAYDSLSELLSTRYLLGGTLLSAINSDSHLLFPRLSSPPEIIGDCHFLLTGKGLPRGHGTRWESRSSTTLYSAPPVAEANPLRYSLAS